MTVRVIATLGAVAMSGVLALAQGAGRGGTGTVILEQAPRDRSIAIPREKLAEYLKDVEARSSRRFA